MHRNTAESLDEEPSLNSRLRLLAVAVLFALAACPAATRAAPSNPRVIADELIVKLRPGTAMRSDGLAQGADAWRIDALLQGTGTWQSQSLGVGSDTYLLHVGRGSDTERLATQLAADPAVVFAELNHSRRMFREPNDPVLSQQWGLHNIQAFEAWDITTGTSVPIAIVDTGVSPSHPDLSDKLLPGFNAINGGTDTSDDEGHGTAMAGVAAADSDNGKGIAGVCWGCSIMPVKALSGDGMGDDATIALGIRWATDHGARIINLSLGGPDDTQILRDSVQYAHDRGVLLIASSGNGQAEGNRINYPAAYDLVTAVSATGNTDVVTGFSTTGDFVDISAPGVGIWSTQWTPEGDTYAPENGTSPAAPYVSGVAGLVWSVRPDLSNDAVRCVLEASADDKGTPGKDSDYGWGRVNALKAVQLAQNFSTCPLDTPAPAPQSAPQQPAPAPANAPAAFSPVAPVPSTRDVTYFPETSHTLRGDFKNYWQRNGGLPIFGLPISEEFGEQSDDGQTYTVQYFERHRLELHPNTPAPYNVQLSRLGDLTLQSQGRDWFTFPKGAQAPGCLFFEQTGHSLCGAFLNYWRSNGLEFDGRAGKSQAESLALFGQPLSEPQVEEIAPGVSITVQWFERARFEDHGSEGVLLGLLGNNLAQTRGWKSEKAKR